MKFVNVFFGIGLSCLFVLSGCSRDCNSEVPFSARIDIASEYAYTSVYGLTQDGPGPELLASVDFGLPLNMREGKTTFVFQSETGKDTLSIQYELASKFESSECGFYLAGSNYQVTEPTSFSGAAITSSSFYYVTVRIND